MPLVATSVEVLVYSPSPYGLYSVRSIQIYFEG
jgi:hypothetical protein